MLLTPVENCVHDADTIDRFMGYADTLRDTDACIEWQKKLHDGYGQFVIQGTSYKAHRISYEIFVGIIPWHGLSELCILHECDNRACINPKHLFPGTRCDNNKDRVAKGRGRHTDGEDHGGSVITDIELFDIMELYYQERWSALSIAEKYGIGSSTVKRYILGQARTKVTQKYLAGLSQDEMSLVGHTLKDSEVLDILVRRFEHGWSVRDLAKRYNVGLSSVRRYLCGETKSHVYNSYMNRR